MGIYIYPFSSGATFTGGTVPGDTNFQGNLSAATYYSGATELSEIIRNIASQFSGASTEIFIQPGINTYTGGTPSYPTVNVSGLSIEYLIVSGNSVFNTGFATSFSGETLFSGNSNLNQIFSHTGHTHQFSSILNTAHTHSVSEIDNLSNLLNTKINKSGDTMTGGLITPSLSATTLSGGTIYSGRTDLSDLFVTANYVQSLQTFIQPGNNTYTGGTILRPTVNVSGLSIYTIIASGNSVFTGTLSGGSSFSANSIFSGNTNLNDIFSHSGHTHQFSSILNTAHTHSINEIDNLSNLLNTKVNKSGDTMTGGLITLFLSATTLSGGAIYSGTTNLSDLFSSTGHTHQFSAILNTAHTHTFSEIEGLQNAFNTKVNKSGDTMTGQLNLPSLSATSLSGGTIFSGNTDLENLFIINGNSNGPGFAIITGKTNGVLQFKGLSAGTNISITTNSDTILINSTGGGNSNVNNGLNTYTGGTSSNPSINVSALTISSLLVSGNTILSSTTASTLRVLSLSGGGALMVVTDNNGNLSTQSIPSVGQSTVIRNGLNTYTAGTNADYTVNISALTINTLTASGNSVFTGTLSGGSSFSASTIFSGSTNLSNIFSSTGHTHQFSSILNTAHTHSVSEVDNLSNLLNTKVNKSGDTMTGGLSAISISATTYYSGSTPLNNLLGEINSGTNIGRGIPVFSGKSGTNLLFSTISGGTNISITSGDTIVINSVPGSETSIVVDLATTAVIPNVTYNNGTSGVGATLRGSFNGFIPTQDGFAVFSGYTLLVKNQTNQIHNGIYYVTDRGSLTSVFILTRDVTSDTTLELSPQLVFVSSGTTNRGLYFNQSTADPVIGTDNIFYDSISPFSLYVTQLVNGTQVNGQIPYWTATGRQLSKGDATFVRNPSTGFIGINATATPISTLDIDGSVGMGSISFVNSNTALTTSNKMILVSANTTDIYIGLPAASTTNRREYTISKIDSTNKKIIISGTSSVIDGKSTITINNQWSSLTVKSNGISYYSVVPLVENYFSISGGTVTGATNFSGNLSAATIYSGNTNLSDLFITTGSTSGIGTSIFINKTGSQINFKSISAGTNTTITDNGSNITINSTGGGATVNNGTNTFTAGTSTFQSVNITALTINTLTASGNSIFTGTLSGGSFFSANTIYSGSTNLNNIFSPLGHTHQFSTILNTAHTHSVSEVDNLNDLLNTKVNKSGDTMTGDLIVPSLSSTTISGGTYYSGSTPLSTIISNTVNANKIHKIVSSNTIVPNNTTTTIYAGIVIKGFIGHGYQHLIDGGSYNFIGNGNQQKSLGGSYNFVGNGYLNYVGNAASKYGFLGNGFANKLYSNFSTVINGTANYIHLNAEFGFVGTGNQNRAHAKYSSILNGKNNKVDNNSNYSFINSGKNNLINAGTTYSSILNGYNNIINSSFQNISIINGNNNTVSITRGFIINGVNNSVINGNGKYSFILNGKNNTVNLPVAESGPYSINYFLKRYGSGTILAGRDNSTNGLYSTIGNGIGNIINTNNTNASYNYWANTIMNGRVNRIYGNSRYNFISNGYYNLINSSDSSSISSSRLSKIYSSSYITILGGASNLVSGAGSVSLISCVNVTVTGDSNSNSTVIGVESYDASNIANTVVVSNLLILNTGTTNVFSATTLSANTVQSNSLAGGGTLMVVTNNNGILSTQSIPAAGQSTIIRNGINTYTAGTFSDYSVNISALTINTITASGNSIFIGTLSGGSSFSANSIFSGSTNLGNLFITTGSTSGVGTSIFINKTGSQLNLKSLSAGTNVTFTDSGSNITINSTGGSGGGTTVNNGTNTFTAGTSSFQSVNVTGLTINNLQVSGTSVLNTLSANTVSATTIYSGSTNINQLFALTGHSHAGGIGFTIDNGASLITTGFKGYIIMPYDAIIKSWTILADVSGSIEIDVWKDTYANYPPTIADSIAGTEKISLVSQLKNQDLSLTSWTTLLSSGDILAFNVDSVSTVKRVTVMINVIKLN